LLTDHPFTPSFLQDLSILTEFAFMSILFLFINGTCFAVHCSAVTDPILKTTVFLSLPLFKVNAFKRRTCTFFFLDKKIIV